MCVVTVNAASAFYVTRMMYVTVRVEVLKVELDSERVRARNLPRRVTSASTDFAFDSAFTTRQSRTGGVLGAVPSPAVMGARKIFSQGSKFRDAKKLTTFFSRHAPSKHRSSL